MSGGFPIVSDTRVTFALLSSQIRLSVCLSSASLAVGLTLLHTTQIVEPFGTILHRFVNKMCYVMLRNRVQLSTFL